MWQLPEVREAVGCQEEMGDCQEVRLGGALEKEDTHGVRGARASPVSTTQKKSLW